MSNITEEVDMQVQHIIGLSIAEFANEHGFAKNFQKQTELHETFISKIANQGYSEMSYPSTLSGVAPNLPETKLNDGYDYEEAFLESWHTNLGSLNPIFAEYFSDSPQYCWYVTYQLNLPGNIYTASVKYWGNRNPQLSIFRNEL